VAHQVQRGAHLLARAVRVTRIGAGWRGRPAGIGGLRQVLLTQGLVALEAARGQHHTQACRQAHRRTFALHHHARHTRALHHQFSEGRVHPQAHLALP